MLINQKDIDAYGGNVEFYIQKGYLRKYDSLKMFAEKMNISKYYENLVETIKEYNERVDTKKDKFGKKVFSQKFDLNNNIYAGIITPSIHYTMGDLTINYNAKLIKTNGKF